MAFAEYPVVASSGSGGITKVADSIERNALTPADGDIVIQLDNDFLYEWNGSSWAVLADRTWQTAGSILGAKTFDTASRWSVATNQQVFGVTNTITDNYNAPSANRVYTIPDVGADAAYVLTAGNQTIGGTKTFSSTISGSISGNAGTVTNGAYVNAANTFSLAQTITATSNQLVLYSGVNQLTLNSGTSAAARTYTVPDAGTTADFVMSAGSSTIAGARTFSSAVTINPASNQVVLSSGVSQLTLNSGTSAAARTYAFPDVGTSANFVMDQGNQTIAGTKTFSSAVTINPASNQIVLSSGVSQLTLNSGTSAAPRTYTVPDTGTTDTFAMLGGSQTFGGAKTFSSAVTVSAASNQLVLSSGINQLTLNSSTSGAARTYAFPDVGTSGTVAMLEGSQTFSGLKTFSSGLAISGGSAANNTIWVASNTLNIRGGTSGTDIYNTSGTVTVDITDGGSVALGPTSGGSLTHKVQSGAQTIFDIDAKSGNTTSLRYLLNGSAKYEIGIDNTFGTSGLYFYNPAGGVYTGGVTTAGAWTWGPTTGSANITHTIRSNSGQLDVDFRTGASVTLNAYPSTSGDVFQLVNRTVGSTTRFYSSSVSAADTIAGTYNSAGGWTLGPTSGSTNVNQTFINRSTADADTVCIIQKGAATTTTANNFVFFRINNGATESGRISANGASAAGFQTNSDRRLKKNINSLSGELNRVLALNPVSFDYITGGFQTGFLADELQKIYPDAVSANESTPEKYLSVTGWDKTTARLVKAIQELHAELKTTQEELASLRSA